MRPAAAPSTPCSVVWYDGHPWMLDGEPGIPSIRRWIGYRRDGSIGVMSQQSMAAKRPAVIYVDREDVPGEIRDRLPDLVSEMRELLDELAGGGDSCVLDHHGHCQEHNSFSEKGCSTRRARELLAQFDGGDSPLPSR